MVLTLLALQVTTAAPAAAASISISPATGPAGSSASISGSAFLPLLTVELCWAADGCSNLGAATTNEQGELSAGITIPGGATPGRYTISACQVGAGCAQTAFTVVGNDTTTTTTTTTTTVPTTTTSTTLGSTTTLRTTTTLRQPTSDAPPPSSPTTTSPGPATSQATIPNFPTTTPEPTTTVPGSSSEGTTGTTDGAAILADGGQPPDQSSVPVTLDLKALTDGTTLYSIPESTEPIAESLGAPVGPGSEIEAGSPDLGFPDLGTDAGSPLDRFSGWGIWLGWLVLIIGSFPVVLAVDNARRRRTR
jgi:hypothetical protein